MSLRSIPAGGGQSSHKSKGGTHPKTEGSGSSEKAECTAEGRIYEDRVFYLQAAKCIFCCLELELPCCRPWVQIWAIIMAFTQQIEGGGAGTGRTGVRPV